jgi:hypothetical protein
MLDDLRNDDSLFNFEDDFEAEEPIFEEDAPQERTPEAGEGNRFSYDPYLFGMTPAQRFTLAAMLFITICILGSMFLFVTQRFYLAF